MIILVSRSILHSNLQFLEYRFNSAGKLVALAKFFVTPSFRTEHAEFILYIEFHMKRKFSVQSAYFTFTVTKTFRRQTENSICRKQTLACHLASIMGLTPRLRFETQISNGRR